MTYNYYTYTYGTPGKGITQTYTDASLDSATTYYYEVTAQNQAGESAKSAPAHATTNAAQTVPAAPSVSGSTGSTGADGKADPGTTAYVYVYDGSTNETGFTLERANADAGSSFAPVASYPSAAGTGTCSARSTTRGCRRTPSTTTRPSPPTSRATRPTATSSNSTLSPPSPSG